MELKENQCERHVCFMDFLIADTGKHIYQKVFEETEDPMILFDDQMRLVTANDTAKKLYSLSRSSQNKKCWDIFQGGSLPCKQYPKHCWLQQVLENRVPLQTTTMQLLEEGTPKKIALSASPICDMEGRVKNVAVTLRDISLEDANSCNSEKNILCEYAPDGLIAINSQGVITDANETWLSLFGYSREEFIGKLSLYDLISLDQHFLCSSALTNIRNGIDLSCSELEWKCNDGSTFWAKVKGKSLSKNPKSPCSGIISIRDINQIPDGKDQIDHPTRFAKTLLDSMGEGLLVLDPDYRIKNINKRFTEITGNSLEDVVGQHCYKVTHDSDIPCWKLKGQLHECPTKTTFETGKISSVVHTHYDSKKKPHFVEVKAFPLKDSDERVYQVIETHTDITEKRNLEQRLKQAEKMESLGTMAGGIAHDLNNILTPILAYAAMGKEGKFNQEQYHEKFHDIHKAGKRAANLVQQILAFSRRQVLEKSALNLNTIIFNIKKMLDRVIQKSIHIETSLEKDLWPINADQTQMEQIIVNLVVNARDAMPDGGRLTIETKNVNDVECICHTCAESFSGSFVMLMISDEGTGIAPDILPNIFEPFFTTKELGKGTGMGLSTILGIMHQHDGHVNVYSEPGLGSVFKIYFPVIDMKERMEKSIEAASKMPLFGNGEAILVVDDCKEVRDSLLELLKGCKYQVLTAQNGVEALEIFTENIDTIKLVITDIVMPEMNGRQLLDEIEALRPDTPFLFMSGYSLNGIHHQFVLDKGINYLQKPPSMTQFISKVHELIKK